MSSEGRRELVSVGWIKTGRREDGYWERNQAGGREGVQVEGHLVRLRDTVKSKR